MDKCTHEVRLQYWKNIIQQCQARPNGQSAKQWMAENGIREQSYYLWQRRIRKEAYEQMNTAQENLPAVQRRSDIDFAEITMPPLKQPSANVSDVFPNPVAVIKTSGMTIALSADISDRILTKILKEVSHA